jgi:hypothetical protein
VRQLRESSVSEAGEKMPSDCGRVIEVELTLALSRGALVTIDADGSGAGQPSLGSAR